MKQNNKTYADKVCEKCGIKTTYKNWARHLKSKKHLANDPNGEVKPFRQASKATQLKTKLKSIFTKPRKLHKVFNFSNTLFNKITKPKYDIVTKETAFASRIATYSIENKKNIKDMSKFLNDVQHIVIGKIREELTRKDLKVNIVVLADFEKGNDVNKMEQQQLNFKTSNEVLTKASNLQEAYLSFKKNILSEIDQFEIKGSQWRLKRISGMEVRINKYSPLRGSSYIPLTKFLANKKAIINVKNDDDKCFLWSILSALHPAKDHSDRVSKYKEWEHEFDEALKDIEFPVKLKDVSKFA